MDWEKLSWRNKLAPAKETEITAVEDKLGVKFPPVVRDFLQNYQGGSVNCRFPYMEPELGLSDTTFGRICNFVPGDYSNNIADITNSQGFPPGIVAFGYDPGGNYFCFDFRNKEIDEPRVCFCSLDTGLDDPFIDVAANFEEFAKMLEYRDR